MYVPIYVLADDWSSYWDQIGINYRGQDHELKGCINDARNIRRFLMSTSPVGTDSLHSLSRLVDRGFKNEDIFILTDDETDERAIPTRVNILDAMHWLTTGAQPHDSLFFHCMFLSRKTTAQTTYSCAGVPDSGHGGQQPSKTGDEEDGYDESAFVGLC